MVILTHFYFEIVVDNIFESDKIKMCRLSCTERRIKTMNATFQFKSRICTEETYPYSFYVTFTREVKAHCENYKAHEFEQIITKGLKVVDTTTECVGYRLIHDAKFCELSDLAKLGIERVND